MWLLINADNSLAGEGEEAPAPGQGQRVVAAPVGYGETSEWTSEYGGGFRDIVPPVPTRAEVRLQALLDKLVAKGVLTASEIEAIADAAD